MQITNTRGVRLVVPSQHVQAEPGETIDWPADVEIPSGFAAVADTRNKTELLAEAAALGITLPPRASKAAVLAALEAAAATALPDEPADEPDTTDQE